MWFLGGIFVCLFFFILVNQIFLSESDSKPKQLQCLFHSKRKKEKKTPNENPTLIKRWENKTKSKAFLKKSLNTFSFCSILIPEHIRCKTLSQSAFSSAQLNNCQRGAQTLDGHGEPAAKRSPSKTVEERKGHRICSVLFIVHRCSIT